MLWQRSKQSTKEKTKRSFSKSKLNCWRHRRKRRDISSKRPVIGSRLSGRSRCAKTQTSFTSGRSRRTPKRETGVRVVWAFSRKKQSGSETGPWPETTDPKSWTRKGTKVSCKPMSNSNWDEKAGRCSKSSPTTINLTRTHRLSSSPTLSKLKTRSSNFTNTFSRAASWMLCASRSKTKITSSTQLKKSCSTKTTYAMNNSRASCVLS